jgi:hypothetical protein
MLNCNMDIWQCFNQIMDYAHWKNWHPDWKVAAEVYQKVPESYAVLTPFAYAYLEELIRTTTSEYGMIILDKNGKPQKVRAVGMRLVKLAIKENNANTPYVEALMKIKKYYNQSDWLDQGDNRHSVSHGYMHSSYWTKESFEDLIKDIANVSVFSKF